MNTNYQLYPKTGKIDAFEGNKVYACHNPSNDNGSDIAMHIFV